MGKKAEIEQVEQFTDGLLGEFRTITRKGEIFFAVKDLCKCLDIASHHHALQRVEPEDITYAHVMTAGGRQRTAFINEPGLYELIFLSRKPEAKAFKRWVMTEVLPSIRKTGKYALPHFVKDAREEREIQRMVDNYLNAYRKE